MPEANKLQQWEYHRLYLDSHENIMDKLYDVGERGWEMTGMSHVDGTRMVWFYFKRPKQDK